MPARGNAGAGGRTSDPSRLAALAIARDGAWEVLLANLTDVRIDVVIPGAASCSVLVLDARSWTDDATSGNAWRSMAPARRTSGSRIALDAYSVARVRTVG